MRSLEPRTERAVRAFIARLPADFPLERAIVYGSRARGDHQADSDADVALILKERADDWRILWMLGGLAFDVLLETGVLIQPVPVSSEAWTYPERFPRPGFLRNVTREGVPV
ncbi:MAG: nucleotidyltransferase domain-containing protein [Steroidobacteraceae bacterium]